MAMVTTSKMKMSDASMFIGKRLMHKESLMMQTTTDAGSIPFPRRQKHLICSTAQHHLHQLHQANSLRGKLGCSKGRKYWLKLTFRSTRQQTCSTFCPPLHQKMIWWPRQYLLLTITSEVSSLLVVIKVLLEMMVFSRNAQISPVYRKINKIEIGANRREKMIFHFKVPCRRWSLMTNLSMVASNCFLNSHSPWQRFSCSSCTLSW